MALRAVEHTFTGTTNRYTQTYDSTKTTLGDLIMQYTGTTALEKYAGPIRFGRDAALTTHYGVARPMETATAIPGVYPHVVPWADKHGYYSTGTVEVSGTTVTGTGTGWLADGVPVGATIGFGSTDPGAITTWYNIASIPSATSLTLQSTAGTIVAGTAFVINKEYQRDWVFLADLSTAAATRRITLFEYNRLTSSFSWRGFVTFTYPNATAHTIRGMRAVYAKYTTGTVAVASSNNYSTGTVTVAATAVTGSGTTFTSGMVGMSIGFYTTSPASVSQWYVISAFTSGTAITLATTAGTVTAGTSYVIATTTVTGTGTTWNSDRINIGSRIGFGSTDPNQISQWYYVSALTAAAVVSSDTSMLIQATPTANGVLGVTANVTYSSGTPYVIEDLRILTATTNATATAGGLYMSTGLSYDDFTSTGTTIVAATTLDKAKAVYWLTDTTNAANGNELPAGVAVDSRDSWTQQYCYVIEVQAGTTPQIFKYNLRAAMTTLTSGRTMNTFVLATAMQTVSGTVSQTNNGRIGTLNHGPGKGERSLYFATTTRIYRVALSRIVSGSTAWVSDSMAEIPTGSAQTYTASSVLTAVEISDQIDRLIVTGTGAGGATAANRSYVTQYNTISSPFDLPFGIDTRQSDQSTASNDLCPTPAPQGAALTVWSEGGLVYIARTGTSAFANQVYAVPLGADWDFAGGELKQRLITPALSTPDAEELRKVIVSHEDYQGAGALRLPSEGYRVYYRTAGIVDDTGSWILVDSTGDLSGGCVSNSIQFMFEFRTIGTFCLPARIYGVTCIYNDTTTDSHYQPSVGQSSAASKYFAWRFSTAFGGTVPTLRIRLYDAVTGGLLLDDTTTASAAGLWEKTTDGTSWGVYNTTDKANNTTYIRYTPTTLGDNIKVRALLTQN
jgi:hypothetical protein